MDPEFFTIKELKENDIWESYTFLPAWGMVPYIKRLGKYLKGIELGVLKGETSYVLLSECENIKKLKGVDPYLAHKDGDTYKSQHDMDKYFEIMKKNMHEFGKRWMHIKKLSQEAINSFEKDTYDFILIDTIQTEEQIYQELSLYYPLLRKGGIMFCHDYHLEEIKKGIKKFSDDFKVRTPINKSKNEIVFWWKM